MAAQGRVILYDDSCPLCKLYTRGFVKIGALPEDGRQGLADAAERLPECVARLDLHRARHFIPLVDRDTGEVRYGLDALCTLLAERFPRLGWLFRSRLPKLAYPLYWLITYNRRIIAGCPPPTRGFDCAPDFALAPRLTYLLLALGGWLALGTRFFERADDLSRTLLLGVVFYQLVLLALFGRRSWDMLGTLVTNFLMFGVLLTLGPPSVALILASTLGLLDLKRRAWAIQSRT
jgi:predicted DCC family thiol-disulfide oxidoreductase YuxK